ncbi:hypothetical protein K505DRAFT_231594 [Melanomma pulvis-pyrius CBS 109.77]|uniref:F-box domain-containing protein n=1 Tax=Melanomma pulvis-pyrius CBS 109.77 TaxID=1314802 RepID=A0A6A6XS19_9PLEO|nr:hypothetical protein K505DRAFT_231594 [Melanomma pulvis-pyrius CBS 109.77]
MAAPSQNGQLQSPIVRLPAEIKHIIYGYCFAADKPVLDPVIPCSPPNHNAPPLLSIPLLHTCRTIYHEADRRAIFSRNTFRFTTVDRARSFFADIGDMYSACVHDIEIDARRLHCDHPSISREWLHYLAWGGGTWGKLLGSLRADSPGLKCLRLNFESWPSIPMFRVELWNLLRSMLLHLEGLERIVVIGASKGPAMATREPWSPVHFVGGDDVGSDDLVQRMWRTVRGPDDAKVVRWSRSNGTLNLEVITKAYVVKMVDESWVGPSTSKGHTDKWPENGTCTWLEYEHRNSHVVESTAKGINPSAAE